MSASWLCRRRPLGWFLGRVRFMLRRLWFGILCAVVLMLLLGLLRFMVVVRLGCRLMALRRRCGVVLSIVTVLLRNLTLMFRRCVGWSLCRLTNLFIVMLWGVVTYFVIRMLLNRLTLVLTLILWLILSILRVLMTLLSVRLGRVRVRLRLMCPLIAFVILRRRIRCCVNRRNVRSRVRLMCLNR